MIKSAITASGDLPDGVLVLLSSVPIARVAAAAEQPSALIAGALCWSC